MLHWRDPLDLALDLRVSGAVSTSSRCSTSRRTALLRLQIVSAKGAAVLLSPSAAVIRYAPSHRARQLKLRLPETPPSLRTSSPDPRH
jgi:hypothetical protein